MNFFTKEEQSHRLRKQSMDPRKKKNKKQNCGTGSNELIQSNTGRLILLKTTTTTIPQEPLCKQESYSTL